MQQVAGKKIAGEVGDEISQNLSNQATTLIGDVFDKSATALGDCFRPRLVAATNDKYEINP